MRGHDVRRIRRIYLKIVRLVFGLEAGECLV
jgi:hypothetical protein